jgi:hypothetical protein
VIAQVSLVPIPKRSVDFLVACAMHTLGLTGLEFAIVGNKDAHWLNDLDIAVDRNQLSSHLKLKPEESLWAALEAYFRSRGVDRFVINEKFRQVHFFFNTGEMDAFVKVDIFVGDIGWMMALVSGAPQESRYKGIYRNLLLMSVFLEVKWPAEGPNGDEYFRYALNFRDGIRKRRIRLSGPEEQGKNSRNITVSEELITSDANDMTRLLFEGAIGWSDIDSLEKLFVALGEGGFKYSSFLPAICRNFVMSLKTREMLMPELDLERLTERTQHSRHSLGGAAI